jgi:glycosyltransferase involved in cell wall biosynthesis
MPIPDIPKVTVLMPVYNVADYVAEAINSIIQQTFTDFELLIINDGSTDSTREEVLKFTDCRIRFVENEQNIGLANTLNKGIELARGAYIARMDGDDISLPHRIEKQVAVLDQHPDIDVCGAGYRFFGVKNATVINPEQHEAIKAGLLFACCVTIPLYRKRSLIDAHLHYEQSYFPAEDYRFWTQCIMCLKLYNIPEILFLYRMHPAQVSATMDNQPEMARQAKSAYLKVVFPHLEDDQIQFFARSPILKTESDIIDMDEWNNRLIEANKVNNPINKMALSITLRQLMQANLRSFVSDTWFGERYSISRYEQLIFSGLYFRLPLKFSLKVFLKSIAHRKIKQNNPLTVQ